MHRAAAAILFLLLAGCVRPPAPPAATPTPSRLTVDVLYPHGETVLEMGQSLRSIVVLTTDDGTPVRDARLTAGVLDPAGQVMAEVVAVGDEQGVYRTPPWIIPHRSLAGDWSLDVAAASPEATGGSLVSFRVAPSTGEELLARYGFWIDAPTLRGIDPFLAGEFGDADDGRVLWGGVVPAAHVLPAAWIEIQWRQGSRPLDSAQDVLRFFGEDLGRFGFTAIRALGPITPTRFKDWTAWQVDGRGEFHQDQVEWVVFYAPEVDRTYAIGTTVVLPPVGIDAPAQLRDSFAVFPEVRAEGVAPAPLPDLLPAPELREPALGAEFRGDLPITLSWDWVRPLEEDEVFLVNVDYNYGEANPQHSYTTRQGSLTLPTSLYRTPNCGVFNWQVSVVGEDPGAPRSRAVSYDSLYSYLLWSYPPGEARPFPPQCPNAQY